MDADGAAHALRFVIRTPWNVDRAVPGTEISFEATGTGAIGRLLTWSLGDGTLKEGRTVTHSYAAPGSYNVTLGNGVAEHSKHVGIWHVQTFEGTTGASAPPTADDDRVLSTHTIEITERAICLCADLTGSDGVPLTSLGLEAVGPEGSSRARHGGDGPVFVEITDNLGPGRYKLQVWNERGGGPTDYRLDVAVNYQEPR